MNAVELMSLYLAHLRALYLVHQNNHWETHGNNYYGNHLLLKRLYESVSEMVDEAAEKAMGVFGEIENLNISNIAEKFLSNRNSPEDYLKSSLEAEKAFLEVAENLYESLKELDEITLGMDDMIMSQCNNSELHCYLLQQALKS